MGLDSKAQEVAAGFADLGRLTSSRIIFEVKTPQAQACIRALNVFGGNFMFSLVFLLDEYGSCFVRHVS